MAQTVIGAKYINVTAISGSTYTFLASDAGSLVEFSNSSGSTTVTVPTDATTNFPIGTTIDLLQTGTAQVTVGGAGVTINTPDGLKLRAQWSSASLIKRAANTWVMLGDTTV